MNASSWVPSLPPPGACWTKDSTSAKRRIGASELRGTRESRPCRSQSGRRGDWSRWTADGVTDAYSRASARASCGVTVRIPQSAACGSVIGSGSARVGSRNSTRSSPKRTNPACMNSSTLSSASAHATWNRTAPRFCPSRRRCCTSRNRTSPASMSPTASSSTTVHSSRELSRSTRSSPAMWPPRSYTYITSWGVNAPSGSRNRLNTPMGGPETGRPSDRVPSPSACARRDSSPRAARSVNRAARTLPALLAIGASPALPAAARRVWAPTDPLAGIGVLCGHRRDEPVEPRLARELGVERGGDDVPLADRDDAAVVEARHDIDVGADAVDDGRTDEDTMDGLVTQQGNGEVRLERVQLAAECIALDGHVEQRQHGLVAVGDVLGEDDHAGARAEQRRPARGELEDGLAHSPAVDEAAHGRALAARQHEPVEVLDLLGQANLDRLHADGTEDVDVLREGALQCQNADLHRGPAPVPTSRGPPAARPRGWPRSGCRASGSRGPWRPRR